MTIYRIKFKRWLAPLDCPTDTSTLDPWLRLYPVCRGSWYYQRETAEKLVEKAQPAAGGVIAEWEVEAIEYADDELIHATVMEFDPMKMDQSGDRWAVQGPDGWLFANRAQLIDIGLKIKLGEYSLEWLASYLQPYLEPLTDGGQRTCAKCLATILSWRHYSGYTSVDGAEGKCPWCHGYDTSWQVVSN